MDEVKNLFPHQKSDFLVKFSLARDKKHEQGEKVISTCTISRLIKSVIPVWKD